MERATSLLPRSLGFLNRSTLTKLREHTDQRKLEEPKEAILRRPVRLLCQSFPWRSRVENAATFSRLLANSTVLSARASSDSTDDSPTILYEVHGL